MINMTYIRYVNLSISKQWNKHIIIKHVHYTVSKYPQICRALLYHQTGQNNYTIWGTPFKCSTNWQCYYHTFASIFISRKKITNFGIINRISIFTISHLVTYNQQIKLINFFNIINFIMTTINNICTLWVALPTKVHVSTEPCYITQLHTSNHIILSLNLFWLFWCNDSS